MFLVQYLLRYIKKDKDYIFYILFCCLFDTFSSYSFLEKGKPKCCHISNLKLARASAILLTLSLGSPSPLALFASFTIRSE